MSKNFNRARLRAAETSKEYNVFKMRLGHYYCPICSKREGNLYYECSYSTFVKFRHGNGNPLMRHDLREYKSWKHNRKRQWK